MDNQLGVAEIESVSMIGSSRIIDLPDVPVLLEVGSDSTSLSPLSSSLGHTLTLEEDNLLSTEVAMGIEDTWLDDSSAYWHSLLHKARSHPSLKTESHASTSDFASPVPPPPRLNDFVDVGADAISTSPGIEHGPFRRPSTPASNNIFAEAGETQDDSSMGPSLPGVCGLQNLGNTCFMAAGLQCLTATPPILRYFLELQQNGKSLTPAGSLMAHFSALLGKMSSGKYSSLKPTEFKQALGAYHSQFQEYRQHDCQEFLALLLDSLHEQMNTAKTAKSRHNSTSISTANSCDPAIDNGDVKMTTHDNNIITANNSNYIDHLMDSYDCSPSPERPNSPNDTMAGSPRDSPVGELEEEEEEEEEEREDEENPDWEVSIHGRSSTFIRNKVDDDKSEEKGEVTHHSLSLDTLKELSKSSPRYHGLYDIHKETKTSNANFLPKENNRRMSMENSNLTENHDFDNKNVSVKRIKEVNVEKSNYGMSYGTSSASSGLEAEYDNGLEKCNVKRMRLDDQEKNHKRDSIENGSIQCSRLGQDFDNDALPAQDEVEADKHWAKHLRSNRSIIVNTFQGQFKSTVVCTVCKHVSVTYEPFMYLSVPLPHAMERQLTVTYVPANGDQPIMCVVSLNKQSKVSKLKEELLKTLEKNTVPTTNIALAEVLENHIAKILDDNTLLKYVNDTNRSVYAFELTDPPDAYNSSPEGVVGEQASETEACQSSAATAAGEEISCMICLEELDGELKRHSETCNLTICDPCIENYFKNQKEPQTCPVCSTCLTVSSFTKIDQTGRPRPTVRILNVSLVLRYDTSNETANNRKGTKLFGYPRLVRLPSRVDARDLYDVVRRNVPQEERYTLHFVDGQGHRCSRCEYSAHCTGCIVAESGMVALQNVDTLAVRYVDRRVPTILPALDHISFSKQRPPHPLSLYDCLQAFSQSETLDEHNPWFCPTCERNQCATKTLTVHRYPEFLIVYLKRFVFHERDSMKLDDKVTFPLVGLNVGRHRYDLYACVCHIGDVSGGHYTAYAKNPRSNEWYHYDDRETSRQKPQDEDFSNAYILFYSRQETSVKACNI